MATEDVCRKFMSTISTLNEKNAVASQQLISALQGKNLKLKELLVESRKQAAQYIEKITILNTQNGEKDRQIDEIKRELENVHKELETTRHVAASRGCHFAPPSDEQRASQYDDILQENLQPQSELANRDKGLRPAISNLENMKKATEKLNQQLAISRKLQDQIEIEKGERDRAVFLLEEQLKTKNMLLESVGHEKDKIEDELSSAKLTIMNNEKICDDNMRHLAEREQQVKLLSSELAQLKEQYTELTTSNAYQCDARLAELQKMYDETVQEKYNREAEFVLTKAEDKNIIASLNKKLDELRSESIAIKQEKDASEGSRLELEQKLSIQTQLITQLNTTLDEIRKLANADVANVGEPQVDPAAAIASQAGTVSIQHATPPQQVTQGTDPSQHYQTMYFQVGDVATSTGSSTNVNNQQGDYQVFDIISGTAIPIYDQHQDLIQITHPPSVVSSTQEHSSASLLTQDKNGQDQHLVQNMMPTNKRKRTLTDSDNSSDDDVGTESDDDNHTSNPSAPEKRRYTDEELFGMRIADGRRCLLCPPEKQHIKHSSITRHINETHKEKKKCYYCGRGYVRMDKLRDHERTKHGAVHAPPKRGRPKRDQTNG